MADEVLNTVCAGLGFVGGQAHIPSFRKVDGSKLLGVVAKKGSKSEGIAKELKEKYGLNIYYDWSSVCGDPEVDAVCVATPTPFHHPMAKEALQGGKHVYLEMPIAPRLHDAEELGKIAEKNDVVLMPILNFRKCPGYVKAKELLDAGTIGKPMAIAFREFIAAKDLADQWPPSSWAWDKEKSGGYPDYTLSLWSLDMFRWFFGAEIASVQWAANYTPMEGMDDFTGYQTVGIIRLSNGVVGKLMFGSSVSRGHDTSKFEIFGNNGGILVVDWLPKELGFGVGLYGTDDDNEWRIEPKGPRVWGHRQLIHHFVQSCLGNEKPEFDYRDAIAAQRWANRIVTDLI